MPHYGLESGRPWSEDPIMAANVKEALHTLADQLPEGENWDDVIEEARFRRAVEVGIAAAQRGAFATDDEVKTAFEKWGVDVAG